MTALRHHGGKCPYEPDQLVRFAIRGMPKVRFSPAPTAPAGKLRWDHRRDCGDIMWSEPVAA